MKKINLNGREIELYFNVKAMNDIAERCGGSIDNLADIMENQSDFENLKFVCGIMTDLANGAVVKRNCDISLGLEEGDKSNFFTEEFFFANVSITDLSDLISDMLEVMGLGSAFTVPDNVKPEEKDIDLAEIEAEKNKSKKF